MISKDEFEFISKGIAVTYDAASNAYYTLLSSKELFLDDVWLPTYCQRAVTTPSFCDSVINAYSGEDQPVGDLQSPVTTYSSLTDEEKDIVDSFLRADKEFSFITDIRIEYDDMEENFAFDASILTNTELSAFCIALIEHVEQESNLTLDEWLTANNIVVNAVFAEIAKVLRYDVSDDNIEEFCGIEEI